MERSIHGSINPRSCEGEVVLSTGGSNGAAAPARDVQWADKVLPTWLKGLTGLTGLTLDRLQLHVSHGQGREEDHELGDDKCLERPDQVAWAWQRRVRCRRWHLWRSPGDSRHQASLRNDVGRGRPLGRHTGPTFPSKTSSIAFVGKFRSPPLPPWNLNHVHS